VDAKGATRSTDGTRPNQHAPGGHKDPCVAGPMVIDEVQPVLELLAIKEAVDTDPRAGRFVLAGSACVLSLRSVPDVLPGRMETIELWPLSQGEIDDLRNRRRARPSPRRGSTTSWAVCP
jgi:AAA domain